MVREKSALAYRWMKTAMCLERGDAMPELTNGWRVSERVETRVYWAVVSALVVVAEVLAIRTAIISGIPRNLAAPSAVLLPILVLLPVAVSFRLYRRIKVQAATCHPLGTNGYSLANGFLQLIMFEYIAIVWLLSLLASILVR